MTDEVLSKYTFLDHTTSVLRPSGISDVDAIALFRRFSHARAEGVDEIELKQALRDYGMANAHPKLQQEVKHMLEMGWRRSKESFALRRNYVDALSKQALQESILGI